MRVEIKGAKWKVDFVNSIENGKLAGLTNTKTKRIYIEKEQTPEETADTIAHELFHAYVYECGLPMDYEDDEDMATFVGRIFADMLKNYNKILKGRK